MQALVLKCKQRNRNEQDPFLRFPLAKASGEKKQLRYLYMTVMRDHVSCSILIKGRYQKTKRSNNNYAKDCICVRRITNKMRNELVNASIFWGVYEGTEETGFCGMKCGII